ncbi:hypothetical protein E2C01_072725 [Portunus trituberculatus]|uniref:Uncharacterized protein n=1 Tax=Portunus trituberculatus TaxID=210409 RepID=A0A5B7HYT5_PORTR|nr:hypothetical protein [Portunus trituberculatus]
MAQNGVQGCYDIEDLPLSTPGKTGGRGTLHSGGITGHQDRGEEEQKKKRKTISKRQTRGEHHTSQAGETPHKKERKERTYPIQKRDMRTLNI